MNLTREAWDVLEFVAFIVAVVILLAGILISWINDEIPEKPLRRKPVEKFSCVDKGNHTADP
jgi:hypothetical protein